MQNLYLLDTSFLGYDAAFEFIFLIISLLVALYAFRIYKLSDEKQAKLFGWSFLLISISFLIQSIFNFLILEEINDDVGRFVNVPNAVLFNNLGLIAHIFFMTLGLIVLTSMTLKTNKVKVVLLLSILSFVILFFCNSPLQFFFLLATIFLAFISAFFIDNYIKHRQIRTLLIAIAFFLLLITNIHYLFSINHTLFYSIANFLELIAYLLILVNFYLVSRLKK